MATEAGTIHKNQSDFQFMEAGVTYTLQLSPYPILDARGVGVGAITNRIFNFNRIGKTMFTTEVATVDLVNVIGEYHINYTTGLFTGIPAAPGYCKVWYQSKEVAQP